MVVFCPNVGLLSGIVLSLVPLLLPFHWQSLLLPVLPVGEGRLELMEVRADVHVCVSGGGVGWGAWSEWRLVECGRTLVDAGAAPLPTAAFLPCMLLANRPACRHLCRLCWA